MPTLREKLADEQTVERHLLRRVKMLRGLCLKLPALVYPGIPDRMILLPGGRVIFMELKRPVGGRFEKLQPWWLRTLARLGFPVHVCRTKQEVDDAIT